MIELISARVRNFRQLRDVKLSFARSAGCHLTVIKAENGTGKTTLMTALTWGLFGDEGLGEARQSRGTYRISTYRVHPVDWDVENDGRTCQISVTIEFATIDSDTGIKTTYTLIRKAEVDTSQESAARINQPDLKILKQTSAGDAPLTNANAFISNSILHKNLKDVFFIDGDRALAFIEANDSRSKKRERVEQAVRQLLGIEILEKAETHLKETRRRAVKAVKRIGAPTTAGGISIEDIAEKEEKINSRLQKLEQQEKQINQDIKATRERKENADKALHEALAAGSGDRQELESNLFRQKNTLKSERESYEKLLERQRELLNGSALLNCVAAGRMSYAGELLEELENDGVIPDTLPEVVRDRLSRQECICGRDVSEGTEGHQALSELLGQVAKLDDSQEYSYISAILQTVCVTNSRVVKVTHTYGLHELEIP